MPDAFILDAVRTPIGRHGGALARVRPDDLAARVIGAAVQRNGIDGSDVDDVYFGAANQSGEDNRNVARMASLLAGLPVEVPGVTVNRLCASGLEATVQAGREIRTGEADLVLAGGVESMTRAPYVQLKPDKGFKRGAPEIADTVLGWRFVNPRMAEMYSTEAMGETAENVAERYEVTRADQDRFALASHQKAAAAQDAGTFDRELVPVEVPGRRNGDATVVEADEGVRRDTTLERLARLQPVFRENGTVTAGNASQINDGAACLVVGSKRAADSLGREPLARIVATGAAGVDPGYMGVGPVPAVRRALEKAGLSIEDIDLVELNEAFAAQVLASARELEIPLDKLNVNGGAIAIGHPLGCSGARLIGTLAHELQVRGARYGIATMCIGVGQGLATVIENPAA